jgi:hypothetical protein
MALLNFDATQVEPQQSFDAVPPGKYEAIIIDSEMKQTKAGTGEYLQLTFEIVGPSHSGRKVWSRLNLSNPNRTAEEIAQRELSAICMVCGIGQIQDSEELHDIPLIIDVAVENNQNSGSQNNRIKGYQTAKGEGIKTAPAANVAAAKAAAFTGGASTIKKPWGK